MTPATPSPRLRPLNDLSPDPGGKYVLYWMQQSQRAHANHALEEAVRLADLRGTGVVVAFGLTGDYPEANVRHYAFMLEGLAETAAELRRRGILFVVRRGSPERVAIELAEESSVVVCDRGYLRHQRQWREEVARHAGRLVVQIESDVVVPAEAASNHREVAARTLRPKILALQGEFFRLPEEKGTKVSALHLSLEGDVDPEEPSETLARLNIDRSVPPVRGFRGGTSEARRRLARFLEESLSGYGDRHNDPARPRVSFLSPYLHFGQISPVEVALAVKNSRRGTWEDRKAFLDELVVRRELGVNFVTFEPRYDDFAALPSWALEELHLHRGDPRPHLYGRAELDRGATGDRYWNAAMREMKVTGYLPNYMRMYWGKKILEWSETPEEAFRTALYLNNRYFLDGRDPNAYVNVAWIFGLHDRPWFERPVFGKVRYMNDRGLERKFDMEAYLRRVEELTAAEEG